VGGLANLRSFGSSLSNSLDVDGNQYPGMSVYSIVIYTFSTDIAVGAFMSQQVFLLRYGRVVLLHWIVHKTLN